jgi:hypothetical protein
VRLVVAGRSVKKLSKLFARADGIPIDGLLVRKHGIGHVMEWQIVGADGFETVSKPCTGVAPRV